MMKKTVKKKEMGMENEEDPKNPDVLPPPPANNANDIIDIARFFCSHFVIDRNLGEQCGSHR